MKRNLTLAAVLAMIGLALGLRLSANAPEKPALPPDPPPREITVKGEGACARCLLKETKECQITIAQNESGRKLTYYLLNNSVTEDFGRQVCKAHRKLQVTGAVRRLQGKRELKASKIEWVKE